MSKSASRYLQRAARVSAGMYRIGGYKFKHVSKKKKKKKRLKISRTINHQPKQQSVESFNVPKFKKDQSPIPPCGYEARLVDGKYLLSKGGKEHAQIVAKP